MILLGTKKNNDFIHLILEWCGYKKMKLLYRGSRDGALSKDFHKKCDNKGPTVTLIKSEEEYIFGGYTSISWSNGYDICLDNNSFIFTLINMYNLNPIKFKPKSKGYICHSKYDEPNFGNEERLLRKIYDIRIGDYFKNKLSYSEFPNIYEDISGKGKSIFIGKNNDGNFKVIEIEVFGLSN